MSAMLDHELEDLGPYYVSGEGQGREDGEEHDIENKDDDGYHPEATELVGQVVQEYRGDPSSPVII